MRARALAIVMLVAGCSGEPSFDERYASAEKSIRDKAAEIDGELAERDRQAAEASAMATAAPEDQVTSLMKAAK